MKEKRQRENRRLQKMLIPKHALMAIHELKGIDLSEFTVFQNPDVSFTAEVFVNKAKYQGSGPSKISAKNAACEKALRDLMIQKLVKRSVTSVTPSVEAMDTDGAAGGDAVPPGDEETQEEVPMLTLISYALHKLFAEWEADGFQVPDYKQGQASGPILPKTEEEMLAAFAPPKVEAKPAVTATKMPLPKAELPKNAENIHPVMLLSIMRPGVQFEEISSVGMSPHIVHTVSITIDHVIYMGQGRTKKIAKKIAAKEAIEALYGVKFSEEALDGWNWRRTLKKIFKL